MRIPSLWKIDFPLLFDGPGLAVVDARRADVERSTLDHRELGAATDGGDGGVTDGGDGGVTDGSNGGGRHDLSPAWD